MSESAICAEMSARLYREAHQSKMSKEQVDAKTDFNKWYKFWQITIDASNNHNTVYLVVAFAENVPVGYVLTLPSIMKHFPQGCGFLSALYVAKEHQGKGIGRKLLLTAFRHCHYNVSNKMGVAILQADENVRKFYDSFGATYLSPSETDEYYRNNAVHYYLFDDLLKTMSDKFQAEPVKWSFSNWLCSLVSIDRPIF